MASNDLDLNRIPFRSNLRSAREDDNFQEIQTNFNALRSEFSATGLSTAGEIVNARDNMSSLQDNIHLRNMYQGYHDTGGVVTASGNNILSIASGNYIVNGVGTDWTAASTGTIGAAVTGRKDVIQISSAGVLSLAAGTDGATAPLPSMANTLRPIYLVSIDTASPQVLTSNRITDIRRQGAYANGKWFFKIQDAIDFVDAGEIKVMQGEYYEEVDLTGKSNIILKGDKGVNLYRAGGSSYAMKSINVGGSETENIIIDGFNFKGNSKGGDFQSLRLTNADKFTLQNCDFDGNSSSSAVMKDFLLSNCDSFTLLSNNFVNWYASTSQFNTCTKYTEDGFLKAQFMFCASTSEFNNMQAKGFTLLTAMETRFPRANQSVAGVTGGANTHTHTISLGAGSLVPGTNQVVGLINTTENNIPTFYNLIPLTHR